MEENCNRLPHTVAQSPQKMAELAGFSIPEDRKFLIARGTGSYTTSYEDVWCREKLTTLLAVHKYEGEIQNAIDIVKAIHEVGGKGHSVGIFSFSEENIHKLALQAHVGRIMVRQPQSRSNAGAFTNGMPMTSSRCGTGAAMPLGKRPPAPLHEHHLYRYPSLKIGPVMRSLGEFYDPKMEEV